MNQAVTHASEALTLSNLVVGYGGPAIVRGASLDVAASEFVAVLGASGSGKTTLLRAIAGYLRPTSGTVEVAGRVVASDSVWIPPEKRNIGVVPQEGALFPHLDVAGNIAFGLPRRDRHSSSRIDELLDMVGLSGMRKARVHELSGGQQQRVALARALAPAPALLLLDEPFSALDAGLRVEVRTEMRALLRELGTATVLVTHDQEEALSLADRVAVMSRGQIEQIGAPWSVYENPATLAVARFIGDLVELPVSNVEDATAQTDLGWITVQDPDATQLSSGVAVLRPEQLVLVADRPVGSEPTGTPGVVESVRYHGHDSLTTVRLDGGRAVDVRAAGGAGVHVGDRVNVVVTGTARMFPYPVV